MSLLERLVAFLVNVENIEPESLPAQGIAQPYRVGIVRFEYLQFAMVADDEWETLPFFIYDLDGHTR